MDPRQGKMNARGDLSRRARLILITRHNITLVTSTSVCSIALQCVHSRRKMQIWNQKRQREPACFEPCAVFLANFKKNVLQQITVVWGRNLKRNGKSSAVISRFIYMMQWPKCFTEAHILPLHAYIEKLMGSCGHVRCCQTP